MLLITSGIISVSGRPHFTVHKSRHLLRVIPYPPSVRVYPIQSVRGKPFKVYCHIATHIFAAFSVQSRDAGRQPLQAAREGEIKGQSRLIGETISNNMRSRGLKRASFHFVRVRLLIEDIRQRRSPALDLAV